MDDSGPNKLVIAGGSGFVGGRVVAHLRSSTAQRWKIIILGRSAPVASSREKDISSPVTHAQWDGRTLGPWVEKLAGATHILNLAGRSIDCRKNPARWDEVLRSRVESTAALGGALRSLGHAPTAWVQMSASGIYGCPPHAVCDETAALGMGPIAEVVQRWEAALVEHCPARTRAVRLRAGVVLGNEGGAFPLLRRVAGLGLGGKLESGTQGISWIHEHDLCRLIEDALINPDREGIYNACAPQPESYLGFMKTLRSALRQPIALPGSALGLKLLAATVLDTDPDLILYGQYCVPQRLIDEEFNFDFPRLDAAIADLTRKS